MFLQDFVISHIFHSNLLNWHGPSHQLLGDLAGPDLVTLKMEVVPSSIISEYTFTT